MVCFDETADVDIQHPAFKGGLCMNCKDALVETLFSVGEDGIQVYCSICGDGGQVIVCCSPTCARVYCEPCIKTLVGERMLQKIHANDDWLCFMCAPYSRSTHGLLEGKRNWEENVDHLCSPVYNGHVRIYMEKPLNVMRKPLRVLSLCDRIATDKACSFIKSSKIIQAGLVYEMAQWLRLLMPSEPKLRMLVLDKLGFEVEEYFACEIDPASMAIGARNYGDSLTQLGDMQDLHTDKLRSLKRIDLVLGCPPSQCFCGDAPNTEAWYAEDGEGVMEFARIYLSLTQNLPTHVFWLCESDASMVNMAREHISTFLEVSPSLMNASWFSYPDRVKYFWGNIPGRNRPNTSKVFSTWRAARTDSFTLPEMLSSRDSGPDGVTRQTVKYVDDVENLERQLGFPKGYTKVPQLSRSKRIALLEKAASVPLLTHMLSPLREFFKLKE
ncbi:DNA (cytosine-5)-methyltransferase 3A-like [Liolophura sinensis]|uniref:DNA (cytosine-5)-methyltransferase 3A-like n=1 Tax=Liolophura sinensis TaxID=3198878 RepID=UPI0031593E99